MDANTRRHPLVKAVLRGRAVNVHGDDSPRFTLQLRPSQVAQLEGLLGWLQALQRDKRIAPELLKRGYRERVQALDGICQDIYERGGRVGFRPAVCPPELTPIARPTPANDVEAEP